MAVPVVFLCLSLLLGISACSSSSSGEAPSAYDVLRQYDFPVGVRPKGVVTGYELDESTGRFSISLNGTCSFSLENGYKLKYKPSVRGIISEDRLRSLKGVSVKVMLPWLDIVEVKRDGDDIDFSVGMASAEFPVENFAESPQCGCGFDGVHGEKSSRFVSSS